MRIIKLLLFRFKSCKRVFFDLIRQIFEHIFFESAQNEGTYHPADPLRRLFLPAQCREFQFFVERLIGAEKPGHQIGKDAPQFTESVLHRSSCQRQAEF